MLTLLKSIDYRAKNANGEYYKRTAESQFFTKVIRSNGSKRGATQAKYFELCEPRDFKDLETLKDFLEDLGKMPHTLVVRGDFYEFSVGDKVRRIASNVRLATSKVIAIDVDELDLPSWIGATDLVAQGTYVCNLLHKSMPDFFPDDMGFIAQGSSSAGLGSKIKLHLWLINYWEVNQQQLRNVFARLNGAYKKLNETKTNLVDVALYHPIQPHYTAYPIFEDESMDPFKNGGRTVYVYGNDSYIPADVPEYVAPVKLTNVELEDFGKSYRGSKIPNEDLEARLNRVRDWKPEEGGLRNAVLSCFHEAYQSQFCLDELKRIIRPILDEKRPGQADDYFSQGVVVSIGNVKAKARREIPLECKGIELTTIDGGDHPKYINLEKVVPENSVTFLKATLGTGKTNTIERWLKEREVTGRVLAITDTSALVESNAERFGAGDFRQLGARLGFATGNVERLSGTLHSLPKIKDFVKDFDFLFIDEADSVMNNLLFASIISEEKKQEIIEVLQQLLLYTNRVVISDGDISAETVSCYVDLMDGQRNLNRVDFRRKNLAGVHAFKHLNEASFWGAVQGSLEVGEKCLVVTDSSPAKLNTYYQAFSRVRPDDIIEVIHSASKMDESSRDIINRTTKALREREVNLLMCSPSITNGVDFNYFDSVFVLTTTDNQTPNMRFQAMMRERQPESIHFYFHNKKNFATGFKHYSFDDGFTNTSRRQYSARKELEFENYIAAFSQYLMDAGASLQVLDHPFEGPKSKEDEEAARDERIHAILRAGAKSAPLRNNDAYEQRSLLRHYMDIPPSEELSWDTVGTWVDNKPHEKAGYFYKVFSLLWPSISKCSETELKKFMNDRGFELHLATGEAIGSSSARVKALLRRCGISSLTPEGLEPAIANLIKYCEITVGADVPAELRQDEEDSRDI